MHVLHAAHSEVEGSDQQHLVFACCDDAWTWGLGSEVQVGWRSAHHDWLAVDDGGGPGKDSDSVVPFVVPYSHWQPSPAVVRRTFSTPVTCGTMLSNAPHTVDSTTVGGGSGRARVGGGTTAGRERGRGRGIGEVGKQSTFDRV